MMDPVFSQWASQELVWLPGRGMGYYPVTAAPYDEAYFQRYQEMASTELGRVITRERVELVRKYTKGDLVDVGIGCGAFIEARGPKTYGYDLNPAALAWLEERGLYRNPRGLRVPVATFWDSLEHIHDPAYILVNVLHWVFVCLPLFRDAEHVLTSKHFRRDEHCWYWTREGLLGWMEAQGFECIEHCTPETIMGREDIHTFVFGRTDSHA